MKTLLILIIFLLCLSAAAIPLPKNFVQAEIAVESAGNDKITGDNGAAIGCLQIHFACWKDATQFDKSIGGTYSNCFNRDYSIKIITAYLNRYCPQAIKLNNFEIMARTWNGGSNGKNNYKTIQYWRRVEKQMNLIK